MSRNDVVAARCDGHQGGHWIVELHRNQSDVERQIRGRAPKAGNVDVIAPEALDKERVATCRRCGSRWPTGASCVVA